VLLSGDVAHFRENLETDGVPPFNYDRAKSIASLDRFKKISSNLKAVTIIQHEERDVAKLPTFPQSRSIDVMTATTILSEVGWDTSKWETEDHFVSWLRLCPDNRISGNRVIGTGRLSINNRVTMAFKMAASSLRRYLFGSAVPYALFGKYVRE
jgi:hypothetical protein